MEEGGREWPTATNPTLGKTALQEVGESRRVGEGAGAEEGGKR